MREGGVSVCWSTENIDISPVERIDAMRVCRECDHGVDWSSASAVIRTRLSVLREVAQIVCVCRPGVTNRIVGDDDSKEECTIVSPMRMRLVPPSSGTPTLPFSNDRRGFGLRQPTLGICRLRISGNCTSTGAGLKRLKGASA